MISLSQAEALRKQATLDREHAEINQFVEKQNQLLAMVQQIRERSSDKGYYPIQEKELQTLEEALPTPRLLLVAQWWLCAMIILFCFFIVVTFYFFISHALGLISYSELDWLCGVALRFLGVAVIFFLPLIILLWINYFFTSLLPIKTIHLHDEKLLFIKARKLEDFEQKIKNSLDIKLGSKK